MVILIGIASLVLITFKNLSDSSIYLNDSNNDKFNDLDSVNYLNENDDHLVWFIQVRLI